MKEVKTTQHICLSITKDILDIENHEECDDDFIIPIIRTNENAKEYDAVYATMGMEYGLFDIVYSKLNLVVCLNALGQFKFSISANYVEFRLEDVPLEYLEQYYCKNQIILSDDELLGISTILLPLYEDTSVDSLRKQVAMAIPKEHMGGTKLFAERLQDNEYRSVWVTEDLSKCVVGLVEDCADRNGLVKAYIY